MGLEVETSVDMVLAVGWHRTAGLEATQRRQNTTMAMTDIFGSVSLGKQESALVKREGQKEVSKLREK